MIRALALLALLPGVALAQLREQQAIHDKTWYEMHRAERRATIKVCENDASYSALPDCVNAEAADGIASLREQQGRRQIGDPGSWVGYNPMLDPDWWRSNPAARDAQLIQCGRRGPGDAQALRYCPAARAGRT